MAKLKKNKRGYF